MSNLYIPSVISRTTKSVDWLFDTSLEELDRASEAAYARRESIERAVTFAELLDEACEFTGPQQEAFMKALARGNAQDLHLLHCLLDQAKEALVKRRLAEPAPRFSMTYCSQCGKALGAGNGGTSHCDQHGA